MPRGKITSPAVAAAVLVAHTGGTPMDCIARNFHVAETTVRRIIQRTEIFLTAGQISNREQLAALAQLGREECAAVAVKLDAKKKRDRGRGSALHDAVPFRTVRGYECEVCRGFTTIRPCPACIAREAQRRKLARAEEVAD